MFLFSWLRKRTTVYASEGRRSNAMRRFRPGLETLEDRLVPATLTVTTPLDEVKADDLLSLREAIGMAAPSGDNIQFDENLSGQTITLIGGELFIAKNLQIQGPAAGQLTISGNHAARVFFVVPDVQVILSSLAIRDGVGIGEGNGEGGGIYNMGTLTLSGCTLSGNSATLGGAIYNEGTLTLGNCTLSGNSATLGGGIANIDNWLGSMLTVSGCTVSGNSAANSGGGLYNVGQIARATVNNSTLSGNAAGAKGGGIFTEGTMTLNGCNVSANSATYGGGIFSSVDGNDLWESWGTLTINGGAVSGNSATDGGGIYNHGELTVSACTVTKNRAVTNGGGIYNDVSVWVANKSVVTANIAQLGADLYNSPPGRWIILKGCRVSKIYG